jgi:regulator of protease activity HflC (stomatin/prohibitin superfamily)
MARVFDISNPGPGAFRGLRVLFFGFLVLLFFAFFNPVTMIPAGHVGVLDFFGMVSSRVLPSGVHLVIPMTRVIKMSVQTQELKEVAEVPSQEGLIMDLEVSLLYRLQADKADDIYRTVGRNFAAVIVEPQIRSAIREITASYDAKALYSSERERIAAEIHRFFTKLTSERGIIAEAVLLRKVGLPPVVANAIQEKLRREQEAEQMKFVLLKEQQEAERKRIEAQGIADFQKIVAAGISSQLLEWKGIEATEKLAQSQNSKIVVIGNPKSGLPIILSGDK